jgi:serine/threonine-protein kinase
VGSDRVPPVHRLGRFELVYRIAAGGMATLYLGRLAGPHGFCKLVALKVRHDHLSIDPEFVTMFVDEARLISQIAHPNVVQVIELGRVEGKHFIAMEYVAGESVLALLQRGRPPRGHCARIVANAAAGLHAAHELRGADGRSCRVVHRDVSPSNILIGYNGELKVVDFGVAYARNQLHPTGAGVLRGKYAYMAPEQALGEPVDRRADVFALGVVLFELTTRSRLFRGASDAAILRQLTTGQIPAPSTRVDDYPAKLEQIVLRALRPDPNERFQTALDLQLALECYIVESGGPVLSSDIAELMLMLFDDRISRKELLLRRHGERDAGMPDVSLTTDGLWRTPTTLLGPRKQRSRLRLVVVGALSVLLGALSVLIALVALASVSRADRFPPVVDDPRAISPAAAAIPSVSGTAVSPVPLPRPQADGSRFADRGPPRATASRDPPCR